MAEYPVLECLDELTQALLHHPVTLLEAPPGAGKSTVLPLHLLELSFLKDKKVLMLEPRRLATRSVAQRLADQLNETPGQSIGYRIRMEAVPGKKMEVITEGLLTRMLQEDNALEEVGLVILDEFHERSIHADLAFTLLLECQQVLRPDLRLLIMSATLAGRDLQRLLPNAPFVISEGRSFPVSLHYLDTAQDRPAARALAGLTRIRQAGLASGDYLVFLPGQGPIQEFVSAATERFPDLDFVPLYGDMPFEEQRKAIQANHSGRERVIAATAIAETSLTIEGIKTVIDSGFSRGLRFEPHSGLSKLETVPVTKDAADQRAGRAGRLGPGQCFRLWSEQKQAGLSPQRKPEIVEADLIPLVLELARWGQTNPKNLTWLSPPPSGHYAQAEEVLKRLGAIGSDGRITEIGKRLQTIPTHPRLGVLLLQAEDKGMLPLACDLLALLEERDPMPQAGPWLEERLPALSDFRLGKKSSGNSGAWARVEKASFYWRKRFKVSPHVANSQDGLHAGALLAYAYPERLAFAAKPDSGEYRMANGKAASLPPQALRAPWHWIVITSADAGQGVSRIQSAMPLEEEEVSAHTFSSEEVFWDERKDQLVARTLWKYGEIVVKERGLDKIPQELHRKAVWEYLRKNRLKVFRSEEEDQQWLLRASMAASMNANWTISGEQSLLDQLEDWFDPAELNIRKGEQLRKLDWTPLAEHLLSWEMKSWWQQEFPAKLEVPSGSQLPLRYRDGEAPILATRLQEVFGWIESPRIGEGKITVIIELLSPGFKPVQTTSDLNNFWKSTYFEVRKELQRRYPRHSWPEKPLEAQAVRGAPKRFK